MNRFSFILFVLAFLALEIQATHANGFFSGAPVINEPTVIGNRPETPFLFAIPTSGERPMQWKAKDLPQGLQLDEQTGIITGAVEKEGVYKVLLTASNKIGETQNMLEIQIGQTLALTPPMGWNGWNLFMCDVDETLVKEMADALVSTGLRDLGYQYINLDDGWQEDKRDANGEIVINRQKFPNGIKYLADYLHERGLKLGIYSDAAELTCEKRAGSYGYEERDIARYVEWGVDLLKYDYCFAPEDKDTAIVRYRKMAEIVQNCNRSILFSVCEWGDREPWTWAPGLDANMWRTTHDIRDIWINKSKKNNGIFQIFERNIQLGNVAGPGKWNDPDMLMVGLYGKGLATTRESYIPPITEYRAQFAIWCLMASPLLISADIRQMPEEIRGILMHKGLIAINQDKWGKQAQSIYQDDNVHIILKPLSDGSVAIGILNKKESVLNYQADWKRLLPGKMQKTTDVWTGKTMSPKELKTVSIDSHDCLVFKVYIK